MPRNLCFALFVCASCLLAVPPSEPGITPARIQAQASMARLPLRFEENRGQFHPSVRFTARSAGSNLQLTNRGPAFLVGARRVELGLVHANAEPTIEPLDRL